VLGTGQLAACRRTINTDGPRLRRPTRRHPRMCLSKAQTVVERGYGYHNSHRHLLPVLALAKRAAPASVWHPRESTLATWRT
jgi:hypothetical protein